MAIRPPLRLSRSELTKFLSDAESIKQVERLFESVEEISPTVPANRGGTGITSIPTSGQLLIGNNTGYTLNTLIPGQNIGIINSPGNVEVKFDGILPVVSGGTGADNPAGARFNLSAAILGLNDDITSMVALTGGISTPSFIQMDVTATETAATGKFYFNPTDQTLDLGMDYGVVQQVGQEQYARVGNTTGVTIPNGTVVGFAGATADALLVTPYLADGTQPSLYILGVMTHDLPDSGQKGYCTTFGLVRGLDTSAFAVGDILYASPTVAGAFTNVKPTAPNNVIVIAACIVSDATNGIVFVRPTITQMQYYGVFVKTTDQSPVAINTEALLTFDSAQITNGLVIGTPASRIVVPDSGLYQLDATVQLDSTSGSKKNVWVWIKKNGVNVPNSARLVTIDGSNVYVSLALSEVVSLDATDYIEIAFAADDTGITVDAVPATAFAPAAPAVVLSIAQVQQ